MASVSRKYVAFEGGKFKVRESGADEVIFTVVRIGGAGGKDISLVGGNFDFAGGKLVNLAAGAGAGEALIYDQRGAANGVASLDGGGKVPVSQLPSAVMTYEGVYNATTNSPALEDGNVAHDAGMVYRVTVAGTRNFGPAGVGNSITVDVGDYLIYNSSGVWEKSDTTDAVASVNGFTGVVVLDTDDIAEGANLYFTDGRAQTATISQVITNGITTKAPSEDAVFDALALKSNTGHTHTASEVTDFNAAALAAAVQSGAITDGVTKAPTHDAVFDALALKADASSISPNDKAFTNDNAGSVTIRQLVYIKANGNIDLVTPALATFDSSVLIVKDASIATTASGNCYIKGELIPGFTGLTPGKPLYVHASTPGLYTQDPTTITTNNLFQVGRAVSATEAVYEPRHIVEL